MEVFEVILFILTCFFLFFIGYNIGKIIEKERARREIQEIVEQARKESAEKSRQIVGGKFAENLAPYFPDFKYDPTEIRFIGTPIDFIVFKGLSKKDPEEIVFLEVKSGKSQLSDVQKKIREIIKEKKVCWDEY
ncbi:MAG: Holliday junction resolvase, partial [Candidatus Omnitrophica bacterium]|nr:Holliday junction resolvase [Candidatus Omnitrophota bacterium]